MMPRNFLFFLFQLCGYFMGIGFSAGGGNFPGQTQNSFGLYKGLLVILPILSFGTMLIIKPLSVMNKLSLVLKQNKYLLIYLFIVLLLLPFAVDWQYSLARIGYTILEIAGLLTLLVQYLIYGFTVDINYLKKCMNYFSSFVLLFPLYVLLTNSLSFSGFRFKLESLYLIHPNILAAFYAHFCLWHGINGFSEGKIKSSYAVFFILFILIEYLLFSRASLLALISVFSLLPMIIFAMTKKANYLIISVAIMLAYITLFIILSLKLIPASFVTGLFLRGDSVDSIMTLTNRTVLWDVLMDNLTLKGFFTGYGYSVIDKDFGVDLGTGILYGAHNAYLSVLLGSGIFALIAIITYLITNMIKVYRTKTNMPFGILYSMISSYLLFCITSFFSEEIGVNFSITFAYLVFINSVVLNSTQRHIV